jgi:hypothetical protein
MDAIRERNRFEATRLTTETGVQILKLRQAALDTMSKERISVNELAAKAKDRANQNADKDLERLRDYTAAAWREFSAARAETAKLAAAFGADAELDQGIRKAHDQFAAQAQQAEALYNERRRAYEGAMVARGLVPLPHRPLSEMSDPELKAAYDALAPKGGGQ